MTGKPDPNQKFVGIQISPISFLDEGVEAVLDTLQNRVGVNVLMLGTVSWLGLKTGRSISWQLDGWPDHGVPEPFAMTGGAYFDPDPAYYGGTFMKDYRTRDPQFDGKDILKMVLPAAHARGMKVYIELMEPFFKYTGHGSVNTVDIPNLAQAMEIDIFGRIGSDPSTSHPGYRNWILSMIEDQVRNHPIDGVMWCNERNSPLDTLIQGGAPGDFSSHARREAMERGIDVEACRKALLNLYDFMQEAKAGKSFADGAFITFLRTLLANPEALIWERFWLERNKDLDRELYGLVKWCKPSLPFGLNVWNRNHFNIFRKAQWPWEEQTLYADWVKPITYQHQAGEVFAKELGFFQKTILRDFSPDEATAVLYRLLGLKEAPYVSVIQTGMDPDTYVEGQCADAVRGVNGKAKVFMGIGVDAPRTRADQAQCTPDIAYRSVMATYRAGGDGIVLAPNYASMKLTNLDGVAKALTELGLK
ncbi:hypothetical protein SAMN05880590_104212 [Rhizobium sp. RU35A]|uniref:hypothetical protein n=1 Tax=Rhizobium sp. RU35A TaxID=1907414 RepID=UPI000956368D|nr:hypothetical protein [Rhizobium sp. RU35A]SIQ46042.1 hypothetical protein SAMN05880590_104212 [Rhizobium sp. RU35A]